MTPFLRFAGGKRWLEPSVAQLVEQSSTVVDPFVGSGGLVLPMLSRSNIIAEHLATSHSGLIVGDASPYIEAMWRAMLEDPYRLAAKAATQFGRARNKDGYYEVRKELNALEGGQMMIASRFVALNRTCFKGLLRVNSRGEINAPFGHLANPTLDIDTLTKFGLAVQRLRTAVVSGSWIDTLEFAVRSATERTLLLIDPPYAGSTHVAFCARRWTALDRLQLSNHVQRLVTERNWSAIICDDVSPDAQDAWRWANWSFTRRPRRMANANGRGGDRGDEILAIVSARR